MNGPLARKAKSSICPGVSTRMRSAFAVWMSFVMFWISSAIRSAAIISAPLGPRAYFSIMSPTST